MRLFGLDISRRGVRIPCTQLYIPIPLLLPLLLHFLPAASAQTVSFPSRGTFSQQRDWIDNLSNGCSTASQDAATSLTTATNPFNQLQQLPPTIQAQVVRHEFHSTHNVVTRRMASTPQAAAGPTPEAAPAAAAPDREEVMIGGHNGMNPLTFHFERTPEGNLRPVRVEEASVATYAEGVNAAQQNEGLVVSATDSDQRTCYMHALRGP